MEQTTQTETVKDKATQTETVSPRKYRLTDECIGRYGSTLFRIQALIDFGHVKAGELGGFIEKEANLSQTGHAWVRDEAKVFQEAVVCDNALIANSAKVWGRAKVKDDATVSDNASVFDDAMIANIAHVYGNADVYDDTEVRDSASVSGDARIFNNAIIKDGACITDDTHVSDNACVSGTAAIAGDSNIFGNTHVSGNSRLYNVSAFDDTKISGGTHLSHVNIGKKANISSNEDVFTITNMGSYRQTLTAYKQEDGTIGVNRGCFYGTIDEFEDAVIEEHGNNCYAQEYLLAIPLIKRRLG